MNSFKESRAFRKKKRVCFIYYQYFDSLSYREGMTLKENDFEVDILCLRSSKKEKIFQKIDGIQVIYLQAREAAEKSTIFYFLRLALFFLKSFVTVTFLQLIKRYGIIHVTTPPDFMVFAAIIPKLFGVKIILDIHDIGPELFMRKLRIDEKKRIIGFIKWIEKISTHFADHVIIVTDFWREKLITRSVQSSKCTTLLNVPDEKLFSPQALKKCSPKKTFDLYYHGSLEEHFGVDTMLCAMPEIKKNITNVILTIYCGKKGRILNDMLELRKNLKMEEYVFFNDYVPFYKLPEILSNADLGLVPTKGDVFSDEAVSMKSFEYIFLGIPIVISRTKAHSYYYTKDMVKFFTPEDSNDLVNAVIKLYNHPDERKQMVLNSANFIKHYGWNKSKQIYLSIFDTLLQNQGS